MNAHVTVYVCVCLNVDAHVTSYVHFCLTEDAHDSHESLYLCKLLSMSL